MDICITTSTGGTSAGFLIFFRKANHLRGENRQSCQIGNHHQAVDGLRRRPDDAGLQACPGDHRGHLRRNKKLPRPGAKEELGAPRTVQPPAKHRGKGKADEGHGNENRRKIAIDSSKRLRRQLHAHVSAVGNRHAADENDQRCQCTHEDGIEKNLHNAHQPLFRRVGNLRRSVGDGRGTHASLIGKHPAAASDAKRLISRTQSAARHRPRGKCPRRDRRERRRNLPPA